MRLSQGLGGHGPTHAGERANPYGKHAPTKPRLAPPGVQHEAHRVRAQNSHSVRPGALAGDGRLERPAPGVKRPRGAQAGAAPKATVEDNYPAGVGSTKGAQKMPVIGTAWSSRQRRKHTMSEMARRKV